MGPTRRWFGICALVSAVAMSSPAAAVPIACPGDCTVSDAGATLVENGGRLVDLLVNGFDQLAQQAFFITAGVNSAMNPLVQNELASTVPLTSATQDEDTNQIVLVFSDAALNITVTYTLVGAPRMATVSYFAVVQSLSSDDTNLALVDFIDYDLMSESGGDTVTFVGPSTVSQTGKGATGTARSVSTFNFSDVGDCCASATFDRLVDG
ncbi:MAG: hypothetical protein ACRDUB_19785, partial [Mycobacterium sp.]